MRRPMSLCWSVWLKFKGFFFMVVRLIRTELRCGCELRHELRADLKTTSSRKHWDEAVHPALKKLFFLPLCYNLPCLTGEVSESRLQSPLNPFFLSHGQKLLERCCLRMTRLWSALDVLLSLYLQLNHRIIEFNRSRTEMCIIFGHLLPCAEHIMPSENSENWH